MEEKFWESRWDNNEIDWHLGEINPLVIQFGEQLLSQYTRLLIPLCGKSLDMLWFAKRVDQLIGVELSEKAIIEFFKENELVFNVKDEAGYKVYTAGNITIYQGDFFKFPIKEHNINAIFDRGCTVALPFEMRKNYYQKMIDELDKGVKWLLSALVYDQSKMDGPPFSVVDKELQDQLSKHFALEILFKEQYKKFDHMGMERNIYLIKR